MAEDAVLIPVSLEPDLQSTEDAGEKLGQRLSDVLSKNTKLDLTDSTRKSEMSAKNLYNRFIDLKNVLESMRGEMVPVDAKAYENAQKAVTKYNEELDKNIAKYEDVKRKNS